VQSESKTFIAKMGEEEMNEEVACRSLVLLKAIGPVFLLGGAKVIITAPR
jgi:hypothetical protein